MRALHVCVYAYVYVRVHGTCMEVCMGDHMRWANVHLWAYVQVCVYVRARV